MEQPIERHLSDVRTIADSLLPDSVLCDRFFSKPILGAQATEGGMMLIILYTRQEIKDREGSKITLTWRNHDF
jgi:hypothetical protein